MKPVQNFLKAFDGKRGFSLAEIPVGTKISVHTRNSLYEFVKLENKRAFVFGGVTSQDEIRFPKPIKVRFIGATADWIFEGMRMEFVVEEGDKTGTSYLTSGVRDASLEGKDGDWYYPMEWRQ